VHLFGGDGRYVKSKEPRQMVFSCFNVLESVSSNSDDVNVKIVLLTINDGFNKFIVFTVTVDFV
jgi:hypothetical protein